MTPQHKTPVFRRGFCVEGQEFYLRHLDLGVLAGFDALGADLEAATVGERCPLEVRVLALIAGWVVFRSTNAV